MRSKRGQLIGGLVLLTLGVLFILDRLIILEIYISWPLVLVAIGVGLFLSKPTSLTAWVVGGRVAKPTTTERLLDPTMPVAFVAVDLLEIDGSRLLDIPLLERKRLLDGALRPSELVRITPFVRPPIGTFLATWRGLGFHALVYKAANSRYTPNARNDDWSVVSMPIT